MQRNLSLIVLTTLLLAVAGCKRDPAGPPPAPPPTPVTTAHPLKQEIIEWDEYTGRLAAVDTVEVRARVSGFLQDVHFSEGALVQKDAPLFTIDPAPFKAASDAAVAETARAQAQLDYDDAEFRRLSELQGTISVKELEDARLAMRRSKAALDNAKAQAESARLNLEYTQVKAPIAGRIGQKLVTAGNLVAGGGATGQSTLLTTIVSIDPIYCYVDTDERSVLKYQRLAREQKRVTARDAQIPCFMGLSDEEGFPREGKVDFVNNAFDPATGTLTARGVFENKDRQLTPGLFARLRVPGSGRYPAILIPDAAVQTDQNQKFVYVVQDGKAVYRRIDAGALYVNMRVVTGGLTEADAVVINGFARLRPNVPVTATLVAMPTTRAVAAGSPSTQQLPTEPQKTPTTQSSR